MVNEHEERYNYLAKLKSVEVTTQPNDACKIGQVCAFSLELFGYLKKNSSPSKVSSHDALFKDSHFIYDGEKELGHIHPDAPLAKQEQLDLYLLPIISMTAPSLRYIKPDPDKHPYKQCIYGLIPALPNPGHGSEPCYERVDLFGFRCRKPDFFTIRWFDDVQAHVLLSGFI